MSSTRVIFACVCLVAVSAFADAREHFSRALKQVNCAPEECEAIARKDGEVIRGFIDEGRENLCECICDPSGNTLLHQSTQTECVVCADLLLEICPINPKDDSRNQPLHDAAAICQSPMTNLFLDRGARPNRRNANRDTPLCLAAALDSENCGGVVRDLVDNGANICKRCNRMTPFEIAANQVTKDVLEQMGGADC